MWTLSSLRVSQASTLAISTFLCITEPSSSHWRYSSILLIIIFLPELAVAEVWNKGAWLLITEWWVPTGRGGQGSLTGCHSGCAQSRMGSFCWSPLIFPAPFQLLHPPPRPGTAPVSVGGPVEVTCPCNACLRRVFIQTEEEEVGWIQLF